MSTRATERREQAFEEFADALHDALGGRVCEIILYGSVARGDATERSDVDVLVVLDSKDETDELFQLSFDIGVKHGVAIVPHLQTKDHFEFRKNWPFLKNVLREGRSYG